MLLRATENANFRKNHGKLCFLCALNSVNNSFEKNMIFENTPTVNQFCRIFLLFFVLLLAPQAKLVFSEVTPPGLPLTTVYYLVRAAMAQPKRRCKSNIGWPEVVFFSSKLTS